MPSLPRPGILRYTRTTWITGMPRRRAKSSAARAFRMTRFASSGLAGIVATSMLRCISMVTSAVAFASRCNSLYRPAKRLDRSTISMLAMLERVGGGEGVGLHAFVVHAHHGRHARGIAAEVGERADHLGGEADVGERQLLAVAVAAGLLVLREMALDRLERDQGPVREPEIAPRLLDFQFFLEIGSDSWSNQWMPIRSRDEREAAHAGAASRVPGQQRRLRPDLLEVFENGERLEQRRPALVEDQGRHHALRVHRLVLVGVLPALEEVDRDLLGVQAFQRHRHAHAVGGERAPESVELHGITGRRR